MLDQATAHVPIDLPVCTRGIPNGKVVRPAFQVPIQLSNQSRDRLEALMAVRHVVQLLPLPLDRLLRRIHVQVLLVAPLQIAIIPKCVSQKVQTRPLGVLLYELLTGLHPMHDSGDLPHEVMRAVGERDPTKPSAAVTRAVAANAESGGLRKLRRRLKGELDDIVMLALQKDPRRRYASVAQFRDDTERYRRGLPVLAEGDRLSYRARKFLRRNLLSATAVALVILSLTAGIWVSAGEASRARREQRVADQQRSIAEVQRRVAQAQEAAAVRARDQTAVQRARAEQKAEEAGQQRSRADLERARA